MNKSQTVDCLLTVNVFNSPFHNSNKHLSRFVLLFRLSFFVMKAHVNNSYIRKIHKQLNINYELYARGHL